MHSTKPRSPRPARPPRQRFVGLVDKAGCWYLVEITVQGQHDYYLATPIPADFGVAYLLEKQDAQGTAETYHVNTGDHDTYPSCDCKGFCYHQRPCKHIEGLRALQAVGKLPGYAPVPVRGLVEATHAFRPGRDDEPAPRSRQQPLSERFRSLGDAMKNCPEAFYPTDAWGNFVPTYPDGEGYGWPPDDAA